MQEEQTKSRLKTYTFKPDLSKSRCKKKEFTSPEFISISKQKDKSEKSRKESAMKEKENNISLHHKLFERAMD